MSQVVAEPVAADQLGVGIGEVEGRTPWQIFWMRFKRDKVAIAGAGFIVLLTLVAIFAPVISQNLNHHGPNDLLATPGPNGVVPLRNALSPIGLPAGPSGNLW